LLYVCCGWKVTLCYYVLLLFIKTAQFLFTKWLSQADSWLIVACLLAENNTRAWISADY